MVKTVFDVFSYLSLLGQIGILLVILPYIIKPLFKNIVYKKVVNFISKSAYVLAFFLSLTATLSSLFISEIGRLTMFALLVSKNFYVSSANIVTYCLV